MSANTVLLIMAIIFFVFAAIGLPAVPIAWQWLGFAAWAASGVRWSAPQG